MWRRMKAARVVDSTSLQWFTLHWFSVIMELGVFSMDYLGKSLYLSKGARAIGKKALCTGINVIEDVENNIDKRKRSKPVQGIARKSKKKKTEKKICSLMNGSGYKVSAKTLQFPLDLDTHIATRTLLHKRRRLNKRKSSKSSLRKKSKKSTKKKKKI